MYINFAHINIQDKRKSFSLQNYHIFYKGYIFNFSAYIEDFVTTYKNHLIVGFGSPVTLHINSKFSSFLTDWKKIRRIANIFSWKKFNYQKRNLYSLKFITITKINFQNDGLIIFLNVNDSFKIGLIFVCWLIHTKYSL